MLLIGRMCQNVDDKGNIMNEYTLYLDESKNKENTLFTISGVIIKNSNIEKLNSSINEIKRCIWDDKYIEDNNPVLHCVELNTIKNNRNNQKFLSTYSKTHRVLSDLCKNDKDEIKKIYDNVYAKFAKTLKDIDCITIGCLIDLEKFKYIYENNKYANEELFFEIAMQEIIENYSYFLLNNNGVGNIVYESRNNASAYTEKSSDFKMYNNFCKIKASNKGISFINQDMIAKTIRYFFVHNKKDDVSGLQLADFVAYNILQSIYRSKEQYNEFMTKIYDRLYNGEFDKTHRDLRNYFGLKRLPYDFESIHKLENAFAKIKKSYESLKTEKNKLLKKNKLLTNGKNKLIEQNENLKKEIKKLKEVN